MSLTDIFKPDTDKKIAKEISIVADMARACLSTEQFQAYKKQYESAQSKMVDVMLMLTESHNSGQMDITKYGAKMLVYMTRIKDLRMLLDQVEKDARKHD